MMADTQEIYKAFVDASYECSVGTDVKHKW